MSGKFGILFKSQEILGQKAVRNEEGIKHNKETIEKLATKESVTAVEAQLQTQIDTIKEDQDELATKEALEKLQETLDTIINGDRKGSLLVGGGSGVVAGGSTYGALKLIEWLASLPIFN